MINTVRTFGQSRKLPSLLLLILLLAGLPRSEAAVAAQLASSFTYQGRLSDAGQPADGNYDFQFALYLSASGGTAVDTLNFDDLDVDGGLVNATLDFTELPFDGQALWVEVRVRAGNASGAYTTLTPRQPLTATPYALFALSGNEGPQGPAGPEGPQGPQGPQGDTGSQGPAGTVTLPYAGSVNNAGAALDIGNTGAGAAVHGVSAGPDGVLGQTSYPGGSGVHGDVSGTGSGSAGVFGTNDQGPGVWGRNFTSTDGSGIGVFGESHDPNGAGVKGVGSGLNAAGLFGINDNGPGIWGRSTGGGGSGVYGESSAQGVRGHATGSGYGVYGDSPNGTGVYASGVTAVDALGSFVGLSATAPIYGVVADANGSTGVGVKATGADTGVIAVGTNVGLNASATAVDGTGLSVTGSGTDNTGIAVSIGGFNPGWAIDSFGDGNFGLRSQGGNEGDFGGTAILAIGNLAVTGNKDFVEPHPSNPSLEIRYAALEGPEVGTYFRGSGHLINGEAVIEPPESFRMVTAPEGLTVVVTPQGALANVACISKSLDRIVIRGNADVDFDYMVNGVRKSGVGFAPIMANHVFVPRSKARFERMVKGLPAESVRRLKANGTLNANGTVNLETAHRLGWDQKPSWNRALPAAPAAASAADSGH